MKFFTRLLPSSLVMLWLIWMLSACAVPVSSAPGGVLEGQVNAPDVNVSEAPGLRLLHVEAVSVDIGMGSPIPVDIFVSGTWNDLCAQLATLHQTINGSQIQIDLLVSPADPDCPPDFLGAPFRIAIPLNMIEMKPGTYQIVVNGVEQSFNWTVTASD
jgi:hypothetical protein